MISGTNRDNTCTNFIGLLSVLNVFICVECLREKEGREREGRKRRKMKILVTIQLVSDLGLRLDSS